jgi:uncharacterized protein
MQPVPLGSGALTPEQVRAVFDTLPLDITFVDDADVIRYYNQSPYRVFGRRPEMLGMPVRDCHTEKGLPLLESMLAEFRSGERDMAEFWGERNGRQIYTRYFAVRADGRYVGCLEAVLDLTDLREIAGVKTEL